MKSILRKIAAEEHTGRGTAENQCFVQRRSILSPLLMKHIQDKRSHISCILPSQGYAQGFSTFQRFAYCFIHT